MGLEEIKNPSLQRIYQAYISLNKIYKNSAINANRASEKYLKKIDYLDFESKDKHKIELFYSDIDNMINQSFWIQLTSTYEKILFNHFKKVYDEINTLTKNQYTSIFKDSIHKFIKSPQEINNLKNTEDLIAPYLNQDEKKDYCEIIKIRNYIVHGSRFDGKHKPRLYENSTDPEFPIDKAITLLDKILDKFNT